MSKKLNIAVYTLSFLYFFRNFNEIASTFKSNLWSRELDLMNHVSNYNFQLHVISLIILLIVGNLVLTHWLKVDISKWLLIPIGIIMAMLLLNTQIDFIRWIEINVFGGAALLLFAILFIGQMAWRMKKSASRKEKS